MEKTMDNAMEMGGRMLILFCLGACGLKEEKDLAVQCIRLWGMGGIGFGALES